MTSAGRKTVSRSETLDAIRGVAALQIFAWHIFAGSLIRHVPFAGAALGLLWTGVDLFFVLSGYLLGGILIRNRQSPNFFVTFYGRRLLRIIPLYGLCLVAFFLIVRPSDGPWPYLTFTQNVFWAFEGRWGPAFVAPTWSLAVEEQFYLVLPLLVRLCPPRRLPVVLVALIAAAPVCRCLVVALGYPYAAYMLMPCRMDALFLGVLLAWAFQSAQAHDWLQRRRRIIAEAAIATAIVLLGALLAHLGALSPAMTTAGYSVVAVYYTACVALVLLHGVVLPAALKPLAWAGLGAYSLYLFHRPLSVVAYSLCGIGPAAVAIVCAGAVVVAFACWRGIEAPLIRFAHDRLRYRTPS